MIIWFRYIHWLQWMRFHKKFLDSIMQAIWISIWDIEYSIGPWSKKNSHACHNFWIIWMFGLTSRNKTSDCHFSRKFEKLIFGYEETAISLFGWQLSHIKHHCWRSSHHFEWYSEVVNNSGMIANEKKANGVLQNFFLGFLLNRISYHPLKRIILSILTILAPKHV